MRLPCLVLALMILSGCASTPPAPPSTSEPSGSRIADTALALTGTPYRYGGADPRGFDCSGLVHYVHRRAGIAVPRTAEAQFEDARRVARDGLQPGDLVFFRLEGKVSHVGLYAGGQRFVHAPSSGKAVAISRLDNPYWRDRWVATGRYH